MKKYFSSMKSSIQQRKTKPPGSRKIFFIQKKTTKTKQKLKNILLEASRKHTWNKYTYRNRYGNFYKNAGTIWKFLQKAKKHMRHIQGSRINRNRTDKCKLKAKDSQAKFKCSTFPDNVARQHRLTPSPPLLQQKGRV